MISMVFGGNINNLILLEFKATERGGRKLEQRQTMKKFCHIKKPEHYGLESLMVIK